MRGWCGWQWALGDGQEHKSGVAGLAGTGWGLLVLQAGRVGGPAGGTGENLWLHSAQCWSPLRPHGVTFLHVPSDEMNVNLELILSVFGSLNTPGFLSCANL